MKRAKALHLKAPGLLVAIFLAVIFWTADALADGYDAPAPQAPPMPVVEEDDAPRRDIRMGNVDDNMKMGRDEDGNIVMEVRPRPPQAPQDTGMGPIYVVPQIYGPGAGPINPVNPVQPAAPGGPAVPVAPTAPVVP
jgi:hypothetical protein